MADIVQHLRDRVSQLQEELGLLEGQLGDIRAAAGRKSLPFQEELAEAGGNRTMRSPTTPGQTRHKRQK